MMHAAISAMIADEAFDEHRAVADRAGPGVPSGSSSASCRWRPARGIRTIAPQVIVMNRNGKREPANTGPFPCRAKAVIGSACRTGAVTSTATASNAIVPIFMKLDR